MPFVVAHLSDPHLAPLPRPRFYELAGKRLGGFINWHRNRRGFHLTAVLDRILRDLKACGPDHVAVTGDLINLSLAAEFAPARSRLDRLGPPQDVTFVPGNHDTYVRSKARHPERYWADFMRGDAPGQASGLAAPPVEFDISSGAGLPVFQPHGRRSFHVRPCARKSGQNAPN